MDKVVTESGVFLLKLPKTVKVDVIGNSSARKKPMPERKRIAGVTFGP